MSDTPFDPTRAEELANDLAQLPYLVPIGPHRKATDSAAAQLRAAVLAHGLWDEQHAQQHRVNTELARTIFHLRAERALLEQVVSMARYTCFAMEWDGRADLDLPRALAALDAQREAHRE